MDSCRLRMGLLALLLLLMAGGAECCGQTREPLLPVEYEPAGRQIDRSILVGIGHVSQLDTYLSPMEYGGPQLSFLTLRERMTGMAGGRIAFQSMFQGALSYTENPAGNANELGGRIGYDAGWHYVWKPVSRLSLKAGGLVGTDVGFLYTPATATTPHRHVPTSTSRSRQEVPTSSAYGICPCRCIIRPTCQCLAACSHRAMDRAITRFTRATETAMCASPVRPMH